MVREGCDVHGDSDKTDAVLAKRSQPGSRDGNSCVFHLKTPPVADRPNWTLTRLIGEIKAREGVTISRSRLSKVLAEKFRWRRPRHTLKGRQDADAVDRVGLRLALRKAQTEAGDIVLLFADESEALTHPYLARAWAKRGADLRVPAPGQAKKVAMMGASITPPAGSSCTPARARRSADFIALLEMLDALYGPKPGLRIKPVVIVLDNGPIHVSKATGAALAARAHWLTVDPDDLSVLLCWVSKSCPLVRTRPEGKG